MSSGDEIRGQKYLETSQFSSINHGVCGQRSLETSQYSFSNRVVYHNSDIGRVGYRS